MSTPRFGSTLHFRSTVPAPRSVVWDWHQRQGIVTRFTPGVSRMRPTRQADSLADGVTEFDLPGGGRWIAQHVREDYREDLSDGGSCRFGDICTTPVIGAANGWHHVHTFTDAGAQAGSGESVMEDTLHTNFPVALARRFFEGMFAYRHRQLRLDLEHVRSSADWSSADGSATDAGFPYPRPRTVAVTGADGLVGTRLCALLSLAGHSVVKLSRSAETTTGSRRRWDPNNPAEGLLDGVDSVIHLAGESIAGRFTDEHIARIRDSRVEPTRKLAALAARTPDVDTFVCASAVGFYGTSRPERVAEDAPVGDGVLSGIVRDWEDATEPASSGGLRVALVRSGLVLAGGSPMLSLLRAGVLLGGRKLGSGKQHFAWIAIDDVVDIYHRALVDPRVEGPINAVAPQIETNESFNATLADVGGGFPLLPVPAAAPALLLGKRGAEELALADQNADPAALRALGHGFRYPDLRSALEHELCKETMPAS